MTHIGTILIILAPALVAAGLHERLMPAAKKSRARLAGVAVLYAFAIVYALSCAKYMRGKSAIPVTESFETVQNFVVYGPLAMALGVILPFLVRRARRFLSRAFPRLLAPAPEKRPPEPERPAPPAKKPAEAPAQPAKTEAADAARERKTEESLAAQEAEMTVEHARVVPRRRADGGPVQTLYNIGTRDTKAAKKTTLQKVVAGVVYALLALFVVIIVYGILWSNWG